MPFSQSEPAELKVFISYSRKDVNFADQLVAALTAYGMMPSIDRGEIQGAEKWLERLHQLILEADTVVFILTRIRRSPRFANRRSTKHFG